MGFRDVVIFAVVIVGLPFILRAPWVGIIYWVWIGLMNPHREAWGLAYNFPFGQLIAVVTLIALVFTKEPRKFKGGAAAWVLFAFMVWTWITTAFALVPDEALKMLDRVFKIQLFTLLALLTLYRREHVMWLVVTIVLSIGYFGVKGGVFTLATLGSYRVWGPSGSFIYDNNALALAVVMSIPLWCYLYIRAPKLWIKLAIAVCVLMSVVSAFGSQSRGAFLAVSVMSAFVWMKGRRKILLGSLIALVAVGVISFMPSKWEERMQTITTPEQEGSAKQRLDAWAMLFNLAADRPMLGGGFEPYTTEVYDRYSGARGYDKTQTAHSVYFQVLGEQGFFGLFLFGLFWLLTWKMAREIIARTRDRPDGAWAFWLARMVQASIVGYLVGGAFLSLAYWDMPYYLMVVLAVTRHVLNVEREAGQVRISAKPGPVVLAPRRVSDHTSPT